MNNATLGERIKEERQKLRLTQEELGEMADVTSAYIGQIERGERTPSIKRLRRIANKLNVNVEYLLANNSSINLDCNLNLELSDASEKQKQLAIEIIKIIKKYV